MKVTCALTNSQIEKLYAHAYGTMYKFLEASKEETPTFDTKAYMQSLFEKIAEKEDVATAAKFIQFLPTIIMQAKTKLRNLKADLNALDDLSREFTDPKEGLNKVIREFRPPVSVKTKKAIIEEKEKEAGNIELKNPEDGVEYIPEAILKPFSSLTSTFIQFKTLSPEELKLFTQREVDESKNRIYNTLGNIMTANPEFATIYDDMKLDGRTLKLKAVKLTDVDETQLDNYTLRLIGRSEFFQATGKQKENVTKAQDIVLLVITDEGGNELYFNEDGELTTSDKGKLVYQFLRDVRKDGSRYSVTNIYGYDNQILTPDIIAQKAKISVEEADKLQQEEFKQLYEFKEAALKKPAVIDFVGLSQGIPKELSKKYITFSELAKTPFGTPRTFSSIDVAKKSNNGIQEGWGIIKIKGEDFGFDRPPASDELILKIATVMTNPALSVEDRYNYAFQFLENKMSGKRHNMYYNRGEKSFTFTYRPFTTDQIKNEPALIKAGTSILELYDLKSYTKDQLQSIKSKIQEVLKRAWSNPQGTEFRPTRVPIRENLKDTNQYRDYNLETGEFIDEQVYSDFIYVLNPTIHIIDNKRPAYSNAYMQFRLPSSVTKEVAQVKKSVAKKETMSPIRKYKYKVVEQIKQSPDQVIKAQVSFVNIQDPATVTPGYSPARNMQITNLVDGQVAKVYFIKDIFDKPELHPNVGDTIYLTVESINPEMQDETVVVRNENGEELGSLQETDFAAGEKEINYAPKEKAKEVKAKVEEDEVIKTIDPSKGSISDKYLLRKSDLPNNVTAEDIDRANQWAKEHPMFVGKNKITLEHLANIVNSDAYARFIISGKNLIDVKIQINAAKGGNMVDVYHESWHAFSQLYLTKYQKIKLYRELRNSKPEYRDKSFFELEEILAEDFRAYALKESVKPNRPTRNSLFRRILNWLRNLFARPTTIERMFNDLYLAGKNPKLLNKYTPLIDNVMFDILNRGAGQAGNNNIEVLNKRDSDVFVTSMDSIASEIIDDVTEDRKNKAAALSNANLQTKSGVIKLMTNKRNRAMLYEDIKLRMEEQLAKFRKELGEVTEVSFDSINTEKELSDYAYAVFTDKAGKKTYVYLTPQVTSFDNLSLATKNGDRIKGETYDGIMIVSDFYEHNTIKDANGQPVEVIIASSPTEVKTQYDNYVTVGEELEPLKINEMPEIPELTEEQQVLLNQIRILQTGINNWGTPDTGMIKYHIENSRYDIIRKPVEEEIEDAGDTQTIVESAVAGNNKQIGKLSLEEMASKETLYILSSLHKKNKKGEYEKDPLGFRMLAPFRSVWNNTVRTIGGIKDPQVQYEKLAEAAKTFPEFEQLVEYKLPDPTKPSNRNENAITTGFFQDFGRKTKLDILQFTIFDNGESAVVEAEMDVALIVRDWLGTFSADFANEYISREANISSIKINKIVNDFRKPKTEEFDVNKSVEFARAIGIYLDESETIKQQLTADQKSIEYYGLPYIYDILKKLAALELAKDTPNDVKTYIDKTFKKNPVKSLMAGIPAGILKDTVVSEKTQIERLATLQAKFGDENASFSAKNAEGNTVYRFINDHSISIVVDGLNNATKLSDFWTTDRLMYMSFMNPAINPFTNRLRTTKILFENNALRTRRDNRSIQLFMNSGTQYMGKGKNTQEKGTSTTSLDYYSKNLQEIHTMLKGGMQEFIRTAAKSSSFGARIEGGIIDPTGAKKQNARLWIDIDRFANGTAENYAFQYHFLDYIAGEYDRINIFKNNKDVFKNYTGYNKNVGTKENPVYAGETFVAFDKVLKKDTKQEIFDKVGNQKLDDYLKTDPELRQKIFDDVKQYFDEQTEANLKTLREAKYLSNDLYNQLSVFNLSTEEIEEVLMKAYTYNSWIQHFETVILFFGDPAQVDHAKELMHKRNTGGTSNGPGFRTDVGARLYINEIAAPNSYAAMRAEKTGNPKYNYWQYDGTFNTAIMQDIERTSVYYPIIKERLKKDQLNRLSKVTNKGRLLDLLDAKEIEALGSNPSISEIREAVADKISDVEAGKYKNMEEGDGQGYITFDAYKYLKELENDWSDEQDELYNKIVKGEPIDPTIKLEKFFPPYKIQNFGHLAETQLPVMAMHKFEVTPLVPPMIAGSDLEELHEQMMRSGIQYATFQTGSKLGSITSDGKPDVIYESGTDQKTLKKDIKFTVNKVFLEYVKKVTNMPSQYKEETIFSTQMRALLLDGLYDKGKPIRPEYKELADKYLEAVANYSEILKEELLEEIGYEYVDGKLQGNLSRFMSLIQRELRRKDVPEHLVKFIKVSPNNELVFDLSFHPNADDIEKLVTTLVEKRLIKQKVKGEALIQVASSFTNGLWDAGLKRATEEEIRQYIGTNTLPYYHPGPDGKTRAQKVAIALQGDFVNLLNLKYKGERIATRERLNQAIKDDEFLDANEGRVRQAITMTGVRIPVDSWSQMDFMEVYEFLDPSASNIIIMPTEMVAKSGGDYDGDKLNVSFANISKKGNFIRRKRSTQELMKKVETLKKKGRKGEAKILINLQKEVLQNELITAVRAILETSEGYANLIRPNTVDRLQPISKSLKTFISKFNVLKRAHGEADGKTMSPTNIFEAGYNLHKHKVNLESARPLGITAVENKLGSIFNYIGAKMPATYEVKQKKGNIETYKMRLFLPHNTIEENGVKYISLSDINSSDSTDVISIINSQLLNGFLDVEKDDWVAYIQGNVEIVPTLIYLFKAGVPVEDAIFFVSNPLVREYAEQQRLIKSRYSELIGTSVSQPQFVNYNAGVKTLINYGYLDNNQDSYFYNKLLTNATYYNAVTDAVTQEGVLKDGNFSREDIFDVIARPDKEENRDKMLAMFLHFIEIEKQLKGLSALKFQLNPDTSRSKTLQESIRREAALESLDTNSKIDPETKRKAIKESILSSFFQNKLLIDLVTPLFPFRNHPKITDFIFRVFNNEFENSAKEITGEESLDTETIASRFGQGRDGRTKFITEFKNAVATALYQNNIGPLYDPEGDLVTFESMLGTDPDSFNTKFFTMLKELPESLKYQYSILTQIRPENVKNNRIITLNDRRNVKGDLATTYYEELKALSNPNVNKVTDTVMNTYISQMFNLFTLVSVYQNGMGYPKFGFNSAIPFEEIAVIMQKNGKQFMSALDEVEMQRIALIVLRRGVFKNYTQEGAQPIEAEEVEPIAPTEPEDSYDTSSITQEDIDTGKLVTRKTLSIKPPVAPKGEVPVADIPQNKVSGIESFGSTVNANAEAIKALGPNPHSIDMIEAGFRTRTTRSESEMAKYAIKVGDVIKHFGKSADGTTKNILAKVTAIHPKGSPGWKGTWNKEGWRAEDVDVIDRFKDGAAAIEFEVIKPSAPVTNVKPENINNVKEIFTGLDYGTAVFTVGDSEYMIVPKKDLNKDVYFSLFKYNTNTKSYKQVVDSKTKRGLRREEVNNFLNQVLPKDFTNFLINIYSAPKANIVSKVSADKSAAPYNIIDNYIWQIPLREIDYKDLSNYPVLLEVDEVNKLYDETYSDQLKAGINKYLKPFAKDELIKEISKQKQNLEEAIKRGNPNTIKKLNIYISTLEKALTKLSAEQPTAPVTEPTVSTNVQVISPDYGVVKAETNPTKADTQAVIDLIAPQIEKQAYKENVGGNANWQFSFGNMWSRVNLKAKPLVIDSFAGVSKTKAQIEALKKEGKNTDKTKFIYDYHELDQDGNPLPSLSELQPLINKIQNALGIDMSGYDSMLGNIYLDNQSIAPHRDTTEAKSAEGYPVIVYTIGNDSGLGIWDDNKGKITFQGTYKQDYQGRNPTNEIPTKDGTIYTFGMEGKGRFALSHTTPLGNIKKNPFPPIKLSDGRVITNYTITLTFRRAADLTPGMPKTPAKLIPQPTQAPTSTTNNPAEYTNHSGGAIGSDTQWDVIGKEFGMVNNRHYYTGEKGPKNAPLGNVDITDQPIAIEGASKVAQAAKEMWGYKYNTMKDQRLIRNWAQVANSDAVFAIGKLGKEGDIWKGDEKSAEPRKLLKFAVQGGTGYAVEMAIQAGKPVYVFDQVRNQWYKNINGEWSKSEVPTLTKNFAGIGTREINEIGKQAIRDVYAKTFAGVTQTPVSTETKTLFELKNDSLDNKLVNFINSLIPGYIKSTKDKLNIVAELASLRALSFEPNTNKELIDGGKMAEKLLKNYTPKELKEENRETLDNMIANVVLGKLAESGLSEQDIWYNLFDKNKLTTTTVSTAPITTKIEISSDKFSRQSVTEDANTMYLFTDNAQRTSAPNATTENVDKNTWYYKKYKSQTDKPIHFGSLSNPTSAVIRGLNNAYPISTMSAYGTNWTDANFDLFKQTIDDEINQIKQDLSKFSKLKIGNYRIGQGGLKAKLPEQHQNYLDTKLKEIGIDNTESTPKLITPTQPTVQPVGEVKEGVAELFDSNPELANAVYEALGFKIKSYDKPWRDNSNINKAKSFALKNKPTEIFELVKDKENGYYSIHFKTTKKDSLTNEEKQRLVELVSAYIPIGSKLSTWGTVTKGGLAGLERFLQAGFTKTSEVRNSGENTIPVYQKTSKSNLEEQAQQLYSQYLDTIFPDSKVKDIVYHVNKTGTVSPQDGKAFYSTSLGSWLIELEEMKGNRNPVLINITNPTEVSSKYEFTDKAQKFRESGLGDEYVTPDEVRKKGTDSVIGRDSGQGINEKTYVTYNSSQVYQLGSKQDIEGFKNFVSGKPTVKPVTERIITYTPKGKEKQTYTIRGNKIFNKNGEEVFKEASVDRTKIFANLAIKEGRALVVEHKGDKYVVNNKDQIVLVRTGRLMQWREDNGDRKAVLAMAAAVRDQIATRPQPTRVKLIDDTDVATFNQAVANNNGMMPAEYIIGESKYVLNQNGLYNLVDKNTGDTYIKNINLATGTTEVIEDEPVNEKQRKDFIKSINDGIKNFGLEEQLAMEGIDVNKILANLEAATTQSEVIESISKILKKIC